MNKNLNVLKTLLPKTITDKISETSKPILPVSIVDTFEATEKDIAEYVIFKYLQDNFVCVNNDKKEIVFYRFNGIRWIIDENNLTIKRYISNDYLNELNNFVSELDGENDKQKSQMKLIKDLIKKIKGKLSYITGVLEWIGDKLYNGSFMKDLDETPYLLGFEDGVYNFNEKKFYEVCPKSYYVSKSNKLYYKSYKRNKEIQENINEFLNKLYPNQNIKKYVVRQLAQSLSGNKNQDIVYTHSGRGSNGKSTLMQLLKNSLGDYYLEISPKMIMNNNNNNHNQGDPFIRQLQGVRIACSQEPKDGAALNDELIKKMGSQEELQYRLLYSNKAESLNLQLKLHIFCNNKLNFNGEDGGMGRRLKVVNYESIFANVEHDDPINNIYKGNDQLNVLLKDWGNEFILYLLDEYESNNLNKFVYVEPKEVAEASEIYINNNNDVLNFVLDTYEKTNDKNDFLPLKDIKETYKKSEYPQTKLKTLKESLEKVFNTNCKARHKITSEGKSKEYLNVFVGWKKKQEEEEEVNQVISDLDK